MSHGVFHGFGRADVMLFYPFERTGIISHNDVCYFISAGSLSLPLRTELLLKIKSFSPIISTVVWEKYLILCRFYVHYQE